MTDVYSPPVDPENDTGENGNSNDPVDEKDESDKIDFDFDSIKGIMPWQSGFEEIVENDENDWLEDFFEDRKKDLQKDTSTEEKADIYIPDGVWGNDKPDVIKDLPEVFTPEIDDDILEALGFLDFDKWFIQDEPAVEAIIDDIIEDITDEIFDPIFDDVDT